MLDAPETLPFPGDLITQLITGPTLREVAAKVLRVGLATLYPALALDPDQAMVATPSWEHENDQIVARSTHFESLTSGLVRHAIDATPVMYLDGEQFLTLQPSARLTSQLPVDIDAIGRLMNELAPLLFTAYQEAQLDYWNHTDDTSAPRWQDLSHSIRNIWNVAQFQGWDADQHALARQAFSWPDRATRQPHDNYQTRLCLIDLDRANDGTSTHLNILDTAVVIGTVGARTLIITHSIVSGFQTFDSLEKMGEQLRVYRDDLPADTQLQWRLFEPDGDFFDYQAVVLIALQTQAIGSLGADESTAALSPNTVTRATLQNIHQTPLNYPSRLSRVEQLLPDWMSQATPTDISAYSRHLMDLATVRQSSSGTSFEQDIPPIDQFALDAIALLMQKAHPEAKNLKLSDLKISITSPVVWGTLATGTSQTLTLSLAELALENLVAAPLGVKLVYFANNTPVPDWLTADYLEALITAVNVGKTYPALIKDRMVDDAIKSAHLNELYTRHLRVQLPLIALQCKIRGEAAIDELGYRYIVAVMDPSVEKPQVDGHDIVIRPLAFVAQNSANNSVDTVANMFVIGRLDQDQGPCLLYRPMMDDPLLQYPSPASLVYAIKHSRKIRLSVLAWMPDAVRADYSNYIFHGDLPGFSVLADLLANPLLNVYRKGPVKLGGQPLKGDYLSALFKANANALIELADRQSVSNAESHWATFKQGAWKLFNAALPFLGRTLGTGAWIWQILDDLQQALDAKENQDDDVAASALTDLFLTLSMVLAHHAAMHWKPLSALPEEHLEPTFESTEISDPVKTTKPLESNEILQKPAPSMGVAVIQIADTTPEKLSTNHVNLIHTSGALNRRPLSLSDAVRRFVIDKPEDLSAPVSETGPRQNLYELGEKLYAPVGARWFEVVINDQQEVQIIDSRQPPTRSGPLLSLLRNGRWVIDTRLRLRGGGLKSRRAQVERQNAQRIEELHQHLRTFNERLDRCQIELIAARKEMTSASAETLKAKTALFVEMLEERIKDYDVAIGQLKALNLIEAVPRYRLSMIELVKTQLFFNQSIIEIKQPAFESALHSTLEHLEKEMPGIRPDHSSVYNHMLEVSAALVETVEKAQSAFVEMSTLGKEAARIAQQYKSKLPEFNLQDIRALQVTLSRDLCVMEGVTPTLIDAWEHFDNLVGDADLAIQNSMDLQNDNPRLDDTGLIDGLNSLVDKFTSIDSRLQDLSRQFAQELVQPQVDLLQERIGAFSLSSTQQLAELLRARELLQPTPGPSKPPLKKAIKTHFNGMQFAVPRKTAKGHEQLSDVKSSITGKVLATFHEKSPNVWVQRLPRKPLAPLPAQTLAITTTAAQTLLDGLPTFIKDKKKFVDDLKRLPVEVEESFHHHATQFSEAVTAIDKALSAGPNTSVKTHNALELKKQLEAAVTQLADAGLSTRIAMTKRQLPTAARVEWLDSKEEIRVVMTQQRRRLKGPKKDFLQEYEIRDHHNNKLLWYAHFHYEQLDSPNLLFNAAHLKTVEQRLLGRINSPQAGASNREVIAIYRSAIDTRLARNLFFRTTLTGPSTR